MNKTDLWDAINHYCVACGGSPATRIYGNVERQRAVVAIEKVVCETIENARVRLLVALGHVVEVLDDLKPCGHSGDDETGEHDADCMLCRVEAALAHAEEEGGVKGGIEPSSPLPTADIPPSPGSVSGLYADCMPPVSAEGMTCPDCDGRGYPVGRSADKCGFCEGTGHVLRDHK